MGARPELGGGGFHEVTDLTSADTKDRVKAVVFICYPDAQPGKQYNFAGRLWMETAVDEAVITAVGRRPVTCARA